MLDVITQLRISDYPSWLTAFTAPEAAAHRKKHGMLKVTVYQDAQDPLLVIMISQWESMERMQGFLKDPASQEAMKNSGVTAPPTMQVVQEKLVEAY